MGDALWTPPAEDLRRQLIAGALAIAINAALIAGLLFIPRDLPAPADASVVSVVLVPRPAPAAEPVAQEPDPLDAEAPEPEPEPEPTTETEPDLAPESEPIPDEAPPRPTELAQAPGTPEDEDEDNAPPADQAAAVPSPGGGFPQLDFGGDPLPFPAGPGSTSFVTREIFCLSYSEANRDAGNCPDGALEDGLSMLRYADPEEIARVEAMMQMQLSGEIQAILSARAFPGRDLSGQSTLADPSSRATSSADQMRDSLPALVPDPAFGD